MDSRQVFNDPAMKEEFLDRFAEVRAALQDGGLESLDGGFAMDPVSQTVELMSEGSYESGADPGLEAIVERFTRPVFLVQNAKYRMPADDFPSSEIIAGQMARAQAGLEDAIPSVGRIDLRNHRHEWVGTGWVVDSDIVVTNRHVAEQFAREDDGGFVFRKNYNGSTVAATLDWRREFGSGAESRFRVKKVLWIEPDDSDDVAILQIAADGEDGEPAPPPIRLMTRDEIDATQPGAWIAVIGYPANDPRNDAADQQRIFDGIFGYKRVAPGTVTFFAQQSRLYHDATTLGGNSGSVVLDLESGKAIGLHFGGVEGDRNEAVQSARLHEIITKHAS